MNQEPTLSEILEENGLTQEYAEWEKLYEATLKAFTRYEGHDNDDECPF